MDQGAYDPSPFDPTFEELPRELAIFPLPRAIVLPGARLPLNIFEPRYLAMTRHALGTPQRLIGMIQPTEDEVPGRPPGLCAVGCAGRIVQFAETPDGRFLISLLGVARFAVGRELEQVDGYRRVEPDWTRFAADLVPDGGGIDRSRVLEAFERYVGEHRKDIDWSTLRQAEDDELISSLVMGLPLTGQEKQALLECDTVASRAETLVALMDMGSLRPSDAPQRHH